MGQRANLLIVRNQSYTLYYSHWCAYTLPVSLFWGEQYAIRFIELQKQVDETGWLDDKWAEGGAVLDLERRVLLFYGGSDILYDVPLRNVLLGLMKNNWPGWEIRWAHEGIADLAAYVGYPTDKVLSVREASRHEASLAPPEEKKWVDLVASVAFSEQELLIFPLEGELEDFLMRLAQLKTMLLSEPASPAETLVRFAEKEEAAGKRVEINPDALQDQRYELPKQLKEELLIKAIMNMTNNLFHSLEGTRLQLRKITMDDAAEMFAYLSDEEVSRFIGWRLMHTLEDTRGHIRTLLAREEAGTHLYASVVLKATGAVIGNAMLFNMDDEAGHAEIGYVFHRGYWGQGYGTECVALADEFAFGSLQLRKLYACVNAANIPSARILEKNGYTLAEVLSDGDLRYQKENGKSV